MDTKSKKFSQNIIVRTVVFIVCVILAAQALMGGMMLVASGSSSVAYDLESIFSERGDTELEEIQRNLYWDSENLISLMSEYKSEENILAGNTVDDQELDGMAQDMYYDAYTYVNGKRFDANYDYEGYDPEEDPYEAFQGERKQAFMAANKDRIDGIRKEIIARDLEYFRERMKDLSSEEGLIYSLSDGENTITNVQGGKASAADFKKNPVYFIYQNGEIERSLQNDGNRHNYHKYYGNDSWLIENGTSLLGEDAVVYVAYTQDYVDTVMIEYDRVRDAFHEWLPMVLSSIAGALILILWLMVTTGGKRQDGTRKLYAVDKLWTEVQLAVLICAVCGAAVVGIEALSYAYTDFAYVYETAARSGAAVSAVTSSDVILSLGGMLFISGFAALAAVSLWYLLSLVRLLKAREFFKNSLIFRACKFIGRVIIKPIIDAVANAVNGGSMMRKVTIIALLVCLLSATVFLSPVVFILILVFAPKWINRFEEIQKGVDEVKSGNLTYKIPIDPEKPTDELSRLAKGINEISEASNIAVQNELKNQRMKTELISNVSHDLKTPLTSMVSYIDLLKTEGLDSPNAPEYLDIVDQKTERLRKLTEDLFEAAKASSGAMPVNMETVDMLSLVNQSMGEMSTRIEASSLDFILNAEKDKYYVRADGQLLYRVVENLFVNVLKYAQDGSRVYIDIKEPLAEAGIPESRLSGKDIVVLEIKNISKQQLNINADELMERFKRGDDSRTTEGSGLGLAIAKDLVKLMDGWFEIAIDGDLFKARVLLSKAPAPQTASSQVDTTQTADAK